MQTILICTLHSPEGKESYTYSSKDKDEQQSNISNELIIDKPI